MKGGSLCTGGGGLDLGLTRALGIEWIWYCEPDPAASAVLEHHYPGVPNHGDLFARDWSAVDPVDIAAAGFPCPDYSAAGRRKGIEGTHGQVWFGVASALRTLRPRYLVLENVPGIRTAAGVRVDAGESALGVVLADLAEIGYRWAYDCMRASDLGAPHTRERWFLVGRLATDTLGAGIDANGQLRGGGARASGSGRSAAPPVPAGEEVVLAANARASSPRDRRESDRAAADAGGVAGPTPGELDGGSGTRGEPETRRHEGQEIDGTAGRSGEGRGAAPPDTVSVRCERGATGQEPGDGRDGEAAERREGDDPLGDRSVSWGAASSATSPDAKGARGVEPTDEANSSDGARRGGARSRGSNVGASDEVAWGVYEAAIRHWESTLGRAAPEPTDDRGRLNPQFVEWMLGYPDGWISDLELARTHQLRILGNSVQVQCAEVVGEWLERLTLAGLL